MTRLVIVVGLAVSLTFGFVAVRVEERVVGYEGAQGRAGSTATASVDPRQGGASGSQSARPAPGAARARTLCAVGRNGGATGAPGVTATEVRLATTAALDGPAASLLKESVNGIKAAIARANNAGGVCGRRLVLDVRNDNFDARLGQQFLGNYMASDVFALPVVPSAEGLSAAISAGDIDRARIPVVGSDGMRREQYRSPWVWPVATATVSTMRIMARYAADEFKAKTFAIVWDAKYKFGVEGAEAFKAEVRKLGGKLQADMPLDPSQTSYATEVNTFNEKCRGGACDMVALLLLPDTALAWFDRKPEVGASYTAGAQTLFTDRFAQQCVSRAGTLCTGLAVWTGFLPATETNIGRPDIARYVDDVTTAAPGTDVRNQFVQGAYLGTTLLIEALRKVGPHLTRDRLRAVLDGMDFRTDHTAPLRWRSGKHAANTSARAYAVASSSGRFTGWRDENTGWLSDPIGP